MSRKSYEGLPSYEAGIKEGRQQVIEVFKNVYKPTILNMLALISETSEDDSAIELANDCYNYLLGVDFNTINFNDIINNSVSLARK